MSKGMAIEIYNSILQLNGNIVLKNNNKVRFEEKEKIWPASDDNIKVLKPVEIAFSTTIQCAWPTEEIHYYVCVVP